MHLVDFLLWSVQQEKLECAKVVRKTENFEVDKNRIENYGWNHSSEVFKMY